MTGYIGYDCTADSLHVGNLFGIMLLRLYQRSGLQRLVRAMGLLRLAPRLAGMDALLPPLPAPIALPEVTPARGTRPPTGRRPRRRRSPAGRP